MTHTSMSNDEVPNILMAEDSSNDAELAIAAMADYQIAHRLDIVSDGAEALDFLYRRGRFAERSGLKPVVVLLDIKMPRLDGLQVLCLMKADPELADIPVVILSSSREESDVEQARQLGAQAYIVKPVDFREFEQTIKTIGNYWASLNVLGLRSNQLPVPKLDSTSKRTGVPA